MNDDDDAFWMLELTNNNKNVEVQSFDKSASFEAFDNRCYRLITQNKIHHGDIFLYVNKLDTEGVFDTIGGQLWEACILLCCYILKYPLNFLSSNILELGSGLGLPGLLIIFLKNQLMPDTSGNSKTPIVVLSDYSLEILNNLSKTIKSQPSWHVHQYEFSNAILDKKTTIEGDFIDVFITKLDWADHRNLRIITEEREDFAFKPWLLNNDDTLHLEVYEKLKWIAMGSALVYTSELICLADTIRSLLLESCMKEVVIIQIADRPGFSDFLHRLQLLDLDYSIDEIPMDMYENAKRVQVRTCSHYHLPSSPPLPSPPLLEDITFSDTSPPVDDVLDRPIEIMFPRDLFHGILNDCIPNIDTETNFILNEKSQSRTNSKTATHHLPLFSTMKQDQSRFIPFLTTAREAFVILTIRLHHPL